MKRKKRKSTKLWIPRIKEAIKQQKVWVRKYDPIVPDDEKGSHHYQIAVEKDLFKLETMFQRRTPWMSVKRMRWSTDEAVKILIRDDGTKLQYAFVDQDYKDLNVRFTKESEAWFQHTFEQIIVMYQIGAYRSSIEENVFET